MKNLRYAMALLALCSPVPAWAATAHSFFPICAAPPAATGKMLVVDPAGRNGTFANLDAALKAAGPGDTVSLVTGDYGDLALNGMNQNGFITIQAAPGQTPKFTSMSIGWHGGASHWRLLGLTISKSGNGGGGSKALVNVNNSDNIIFERNNVSSQSGDIAWQPLAPGAPSPVVTGADVDQSSCISMVGNHFSSVFNGIMIGGDQTGDHGKYMLVSDNTIDNFAGDGIDHSASHIRIERNRITNGHDICNNQCVHTDGIQGWNWHNKPGLLNTDVTIDSNVIIVQTKPGLVLPADDLHGITIFDGAWDGVRIINNAIVTDTWHGIAVAGAKNLFVINNTIASTNPSRGSWIKFVGKKDDPTGTVYNVVIRNNVTNTIAISQHDSAFEGVAIDHNLKLRDADDFADAFVKFDPEHFAYDLHPSKRSDAKGEGSSDGAPAVDIEGQPRKGKIDIGAYAYQGN